jgi:hypothetical protein
MRLKVIITVLFAAYIPVLYYVRNYDTKVDAASRYGMSEESGETRVKMEKAFDRIEKSRDKIRKQYNYCTRDEDCTGVINIPSCNDWCGGEAPINKKHVREYETAISKNKDAWYRTDEVDIGTCPAQILYCITPHVFACEDGKCVLRQQGQYGH